MSNNEMKKLQAMIPGELHTWLRLEAIRRNTTVKDFLIDLIKKSKQESEVTSE